MEEPAIDWFDNLDPSLRRCWHPVGRAEAFGTEPVRATLLGTDWVIATLAGRRVALVDRCPHRLAPLSQGRVLGSTLQCPYHGYRFDATGRCVEIPALGDGATLPPKASCVSAWGVAERYDLIWMAIDEPIVPLPDLPEFGDSAFTDIRLPPMDWKASAAQICDNFLDVAHFPFLHTGTFGDGENRIVPAYDVIRHGWSISGAYPHHARRTRPSPGLEPLTERLLEWHFTAPHFVHLRLTYPAEGVSQVLAYGMQPLDGETTRIYAQILRNDIGPGGWSAERAAAFETAVGAEDRALLQRLHPKAVPLDLRVEVHTRADRITVEMRRLLADLVAAGSGGTGSRKGEPPLLEPLRPATAGRS